MSQEESNTVAPIDDIKSKFPYGDFLIKYHKKFKNFSIKVQEGIIILSISLIIGIPIAFWSKYFPQEWIFLIFLDSIIYAFIYLNRIEISIAKNLTIGKNSIFETGSLFLRAGRILFYLLLIRIFLESNPPGFFLNFAFVISFSFWIYASYLEYSKHNPGNRLSNLFHSDFSKSFLIILFIGVLGLILRLYNVYDMGTWDEGWYSNITYIMHQTQNWLEPIYYRDNLNIYYLFDKPPLMFILGSIEIDLFGYSSFAAKFSMGFFSGLMGIAAYLIYSHQKGRYQTNFVPEVNPSQPEQIVVDEEEEDNDSFGQLIGVIFGLSMAVTWFLVFYGRTSYLDPAIVAFTAFTALFAIKAIDHWFYGNHKRAYVYLSLTALVNMIDLLLKAWQGLIVGPPIGIYLFARYYEHFVPKNSFSKFLSDLKKNISSKINQNFSDLIAIISAIIVFFTYSSFASKIYIEMKILDETYEFWSIFIVVIVFVLVRSIIDALLDNSYTNSINTFFRGEKEFSLNKNHILIGILGLIIAIFTGYLSSFVGNFGFEFIYERFNQVFTEGGEKYLTFLDNSELQIVVATLLLSIISLLISGLILIIMIIIEFIIIFGLIDVILYFTRRKNLSKNSIALKILSEWSLLLPLVFFGISLFVWTYFLLFKGEIFQRDLNLLLMSGIFLSIIALGSAILYIEVLKLFWFKILKKETNKYFINWTTHLPKFLIFITLFSVLIILSFFPFLSWIDYMDSQIVGNPLNIRVPGELFNDLRSFCTSQEALYNPEIDCKPNSENLTYNWLFFVYYIGWRYGGYGNYSVIDSFSGVLGPLFIISLPFFFTGIYAFIKRRDFANFLFYFSWFLIVLFTFLPASFQLNYYYLALLFPYFSISSYGIFWAFRKTKSEIHFKDFNEKILLSSPILILLFFSYIFVPYINDLKFLENGSIFLLFLASFFVIIVGYILFVLVAVRSLPGAFTLAFVVFYLNKYYVLNGYGNFDQDLLIISAVLIGLSIYLIRDRIPLSSAFFLFVIIFTAATATSWWVNYKSESTNGLEQMGEFILSHGGDYNGSTWIYDDSGARFALRFYLEGRLTANEVGSDYPFSENSTSAMETYSRSHTEVLFFIVSNRSFSEEQIPTSDYSISYDWLKKNYIWVNPLLQKPDNHYIHLFASKSVLTPEELSQLANY